MTDEVQDIRLEYRQFGYELRACHALEQARPDGAAISVQAPHDAHELGAGPHVLVGEMAAHGEQHLRNVRDLRQARASRHIVPRHGPGRRDESDDADVDVATLVGRALGGDEPRAVVQRFPAQRLQRGVIVVVRSPDRHLQVVGVGLDRGLYDLLPFVAERRLEEQLAVLP